LYDSKIAQTLENYTLFQAKTGKNDFEANRHLLKLYMLSPEICKKDILGLILIKALMALPATDFLACSYLIPEKLHETEPIKTLFKFANYLTGQYKQFWKGLSSPTSSIQSLISTVNGFEDSIRTFVSTIVSCTYQTINVLTFQEYLNLNEKKGFDIFVQAQIQSCGWKLSEDANGAFVTFPVTDDNQMTHYQNFKPQPTTITLDQMLRVLARMR